MNPHRHATPRARLALALLLTVPVSGFLVLGAGPTAYAAPTTCQGKPVTVLGTPGKPLAGTPGNDVIATNGASRVRAGAGDDTICVTGDGGYNLDAGPGNDSVDAHAGRESYFSRVQLGAGDDTFTGGSEPDLVFTDDGSTPGHDVVHTGAGNDDVVTGVKGASDDDVIDTGAGNDQIQVRGPEVGLLDGGSGVDRLHVAEQSTVGTWLFDDRSHTATRDGVPAATWAGIETFDLRLLAASDVTFAGGPADERLVMTTTRTHPDRAYDGSLHATLGGGNDTLVAQDMGTVDVTAGSGRDLLVYHDFIGRSPLTVDLAAGTASEGEGEGHDQVVRGFEDARPISDQDLTLWGTDGPNRLFPRGCTATVHGRGGADLIEQDTYKLCHLGPGLVAYGDSGNDHLAGGFLDDRLYGGPGHDVSDGDAGHDVCEAEVRVACERR